LQIVKTSKYQSQKILKEELEENLKDDLKEKIVQTRSKRKMEEIVT
jgi:hypothetical protein